MEEEPISSKFKLMKDYFENKDYLKNNLIITPHVAFYSSSSVIEIEKRRQLKQKMY